MYSCTAEMHILQSLQVLLARLCREKCDDAFNVCHLQSQGHRYPSDPTWCMKVAQIYNFFFFGVAFEMLFKKASEL